MENNVNFDDQVIRIVKRFLVKMDKCPDEQRTPNNLWQPCADFVHEEISKAFANKKLDSNDMRKYLDIFQSNEEGRGTYFKKVIKQAYKLLIDQAEEKRRRRNSMNEESRKRRKTAKLAAQLAPQPLQPVDSDFSLFDYQDLLVLVLPELTLEEAGRLLAGTCKKMAQIVRSDIIEWKINHSVRQLEIRSDQCYYEDVRYMFERVYPWCKDKDLSPYAEWLMMEVCRQDACSLARWDVFIDCILHDTDNPLQDDFLNLVQPNKISEIKARNMEELSRIIEEKCLGFVSPFCWKEWDPVPTWCERVQTAFGEWRAKLPFAIDECRINAHSILARISEETFKDVKNNIDIEIDDGTNPFRNWNHFAYTLLTECHAQYKIPQDAEWHDDYAFVGDDFERDEGADYGLPRRMYAEEDEEYEEDEDQEDEDD